MGGAEHPLLNNNLAQRKDVVIHGMAPAQMDRENLDGQTLHTDQRVTQPTAHPSQRRGEQLPTFHGERLRAIRLRGYRCCRNGKKRGIVRRRGTIALREDSRGCRRKLRRGAYLRIHLHHHRDKQEQNDR